MNRLVHAKLRIGKRGRRQHAYGAGDAGSLVGQDVAKQVAGQNNVELAGVEHQLHGAVVNVEVIGLDVGILGGDTLYGFAPHTARLKNVRLVDARHLAATLAGHIEGDASDALDFGRGVVHVVMARTGLVAPLLAEVHIAHELAAYNQVKAIAQSLGLQRACVGQRGPQLGGAQVREQVQLFANAQKAALGAVGGRLDVVPFRAANSAQQHRIGCFARVDGFLR